MRCGYAMKEILGKKVLSMHRSSAMKLRKISPYECQQ
jgi:hypothetical protein